MTVLITAKQVCARYELSDRGNYKNVLTDVSFELREGERLGIFGRNGEGKSTLLRLLAKIYAPHSGSITWASKIAVSMLSLGLGFRNELTGRENAYLSGLLMGSSKTASKAALKSIEEFSELGEYFDEPVKTYSSGMRARLGFATALNGEASVLLVDETLSVGDKYFRDKAAVALTQKVMQGKALVLVSHNSRQIESLCNRAALLHNGHMFLGEISQIIDKYDALYVSGEQELIVGR